MKTFDLDAFTARQKLLATAIRESREAISKARALTEEIRESSRSAEAAQRKRWIEAFDALAETRDLRAALESVLRRTSYRYLTVFRLNGSINTTVVHIDRDDPRATTMAPAPEASTYCSFVRDEDGPYVIADSSLDARTAGHEKRAVLRAYCGVPIRNEAGALLGTLCHYDPGAIDPRELDPALLTHVAEVLARSDLMQTAPPLQK